MINIIEFFYNVLTNQKFNTNKNLDKTIYGYNTLTFQMFYLKYLFNIFLNLNSCPDKTLKGIQVVCDWMIEMFFRAPGRMKSILSTFFTVQ